MGVVWFVCNFCTVSGAAVGLSWGAVEYRRGAVRSVRTSAVEVAALGARGCASVDLRRGVRGSAARFCARGFRTANVGTVSGAAVGLSWGVAVGAVEYRRGAVRSVRTSAVEVAALGAMGCASADLRGVCAFLCELVRVGLRVVLIAELKN